MELVESLQGRSVPARVGGVDLSSGIWITKTDRRGPRPCGRGGFKRERVNEGCERWCPRPCGRGGFKQS